MCSMHVLYYAVLSRFSRVRLFATLWTVAHQAPLSMGFSRQEYWSGLPCPPPGDLPNPGIEPSSLMSPALAGRFFTTSTTWKAQAFSRTIVIYFFTLFLRQRQLLSILFDYYFWYLPSSCFQVTLLDCYFYLFIF